MDSCRNKISAIKEEIKKIENEPPKLLANDEGIDLSSEDLNLGFEEVSLPMWEDIFSFVSRGHCLVLMYIVGERSLKSLCTDLKEELHGNDIKVSLSKKGGEPIFNRYINYLQNELGLDFMVPGYLEESLNNVRKIRNAYAHGDWDEIRSMVEKIPLRQVIINLSKLFFDIETAYEVRARK